MSNIVIKATDISKQYRLGLVGSGTLRDDMARFWAKIRGKEDPTLQIGQVNDRTQKSNSDYVWALKDINFEVKQGEILGVIGKNDAGKSTLLKILSKITAPTTGSIKIKGRIASLLEVGTGFHGELTGRENIYLNGAVLGMSRKEITQKLDEIVNFAGVEKYIDTPVKRYSSGMTVRLGFAVAAHLDPDILVVDEVLAVGDVEFQKKAIGKMKSVSTEEGRTILFVSHDMRSIKALCQKGLMLKNGQIYKYGAIDGVIDEYLSDGVEQTSEKTFPVVREDVIIHDFLITQEGKIRSEYIGSDTIDVEVKFETLKDLSVFRIGFFIKDKNGLLITRKLLADWDAQYENMKKGVYSLKTQIPAKFLTTNNYVVEVHCSRYGITDYEVDAATSTLISVLAPTEFNPAHIGESTFGNILWNAENTLIKL